jgi:hypothetical protein
MLLMLLSASASDIIDLGRRPASFKDLQGREYNALLLKADLDGVVYVENGTTGGGRVSYTNLAPATLESWGVPTNRISVAADRIVAKTKADKRYRQANEEQIRLAAEQQAEMERQWEKDRPKREAAEALKKLSDRQAAIAAQEDRVRNLKRQVEDAFDRWDKGGDAGVHGNTQTGARYEDNDTRYNDYVNAKAALKQAQRQLEDMQLGKQ